MNAATLSLILSEYIRSGDTKLRREEFLRLVVDRIVDDLSKLVPTKPKE